MESTGGSGGKPGSLMFMYVAHMPIYACSNYILLERSLAQQHFFPWLNGIMLFVCLTFISVEHCHHCY